MFGCKHSLHAFLKCTRSWLLGNVSNCLLVLRSHACLIKIDIEEVRRFQSHNKRSTYMCVKGKTESRFKLKFCQIISMFAQVHITPLWYWHLISRTWRHRRMVVEYVISIYPTCTNNVCSCLWQKIRFSPDVVASFLPP